jgi:hypothetical protein
MHVHGVNVRDRTRCGRRRRDGTGSPAQRWKVRIVEGRSLLDKLRAAKAAGWRR